MKSLGMLFVVGICLGGSGVVRGAESVSLSSTVVDTSVSTTTLSRDVSSQLVAIPDGIQLFSGITYKTSSVSLFGSRPMLSTGIYNFDMTNNFLTLSNNSTPKVALNCGASVSACGTTSPVCCAPGYTCSANSCVKEKIDAPTVATTEDEIAYKDKLLALSNDKLFDFAVKGKVGKCRIADATACTTCACDYYLKSNLIGSLGLNGYPKNPASGDSTGCISSTCWGGYESNMCGAGSLKDLGANMVRAAINDNRDPCHLWGKDGFVASIPKLNDHTIAVSNKDLIFAKDGKKIRCAYKFSQNQTAQQIMCDGKKYDKIQEMKSPAFCASAFRTYIMNNNLKESDMAEFDKSSKLDDFKTILGINKKFHGHYEKLFGHFNMHPTHFDAHPNLVGKADLSFATVTDGTATHFADEHAAVLAGHVNNFKSALNINTSAASKVMAEAISATEIPTYRLTAAIEKPVLHTIMAPHLSAIASATGATIANAHIIDYKNIPKLHDYIHSVDLCDLNTKISTAGLAPAGRTPASQLAVDKADATKSFTAVSAAATSVFSAYATRLSTSVNLNVNTQNTTGVTSLNP